MHETLPSFSRLTHGTLLAVRRLQQHTGQQPAPMVTLLLSLHPQGMHNWSCATHAVTPKIKLLWGTPPPSQKSEIRLWNCDEAHSTTNVPSLHGQQRLLSLAQHQRQRWIIFPKHRWVLIATLLKKWNTLDYNMQQGKDYTLHTENYQLLSSTARELWQISFFSLVKQFSSNCPAPELQHRGFFLCMAWQPQAIVSWRYYSQNLLPVPSTPAKTFMLPCAVSFTITQEFKGLLSPFSLPGSAAN